MQILDERRTAILRFIADHQTEHGYAPSYRQIAAAVGLRSASSVTHQLGVLADAGYLRLAPGTPRAIVLLHVPEPVAP